MAKVLIVEDEAILALNIKMVLVRLNHEVVGIADNGADAINIAREQDPDIILMDIVLKGSMNGIEAAGVINRDKAYNIIYMTGHTDTATVDAARKTNPIGFMFKPIMPYQLEKVIAEAMK
ncbi:MAG: hypothetical protein AMJ54_15770 [Deltaproteobacteria bacterium SG8_13]|jgi:two-component SAPR family response regulator|nr:MAG: hypothetical protein AMJ54_15770 [Deltaproteobacteria bacterium SG8_13]